MFDFDTWYDDISVTLICMAILVIAGCGTFQTRQEPAPGIDEELVEYVERFEMYAKQFYGEEWELPPMNVDIGSTAGVPSNIPNCKTCRSVGWCITSRNGKPHRIMISKIDWLFYSDVQREQLMFHELGHCVLDRDHRDTETPYKIPLSLMNKLMIDPGTYRENRDYYIDELFTYTEPYENYVERTTTPKEEGADSCPGSH